MKNLVLFDMDGTLTPARKPITPNVVDSLAWLSHHANIGIVTGSSYEYIAEQCSALWNNSNLNLDNLTLLPCNGTQKFDWNDNGWECVSKVDMKNEIGTYKYNKLVKKILELQLEAIQKNYKLPLSGTFLQYRGSLLNWCMIGRNFDDGDRDKFIKIDKTQNLRKILLNQLISYAFIHGLRNIDVVAGGECSVDIYPMGWDKTYALKHFNNVNKIWFIGDRCDVGGNDYTLYKEINKTSGAFHVKNPNDTIHIINNIIKKVLFK